MRQGELEAEGKGTARKSGTIPERLWTIDDVAAYLCVSRATVRRWTNAGLLSCYRLGGSRQRRFTREAVLAFVEREKQEIRVEADRVS